jgi:hypothetical protein
MTGKAIKLPNVIFSNPNIRKIIEIDQMESDGSIFLFDFSHPKGPTADGVPVNGASVINILGAKGAALIGSPATAIWEIGAGYGTAKGLIERTPMDGLHGGISPTLGDSTVYARIALDAVIKAYMLAHPNDDFYLSVWGRVTKAPTAATGSYPGIRALFANVSVVVSNYLMRLYGTEAQRFSTVVGPFLGNMHKAGWTGTAPGAAVNMHARLAELPTDISMNSTDAMRRAQGAFILYRAYLENLTASGLTYADRDAQDHKLFTTEVLTAGGRYYGDTPPTDPNTLA